MNEAVYKMILTQQEINHVLKLQAEAAAKGITYKIDPGTNSGILCTRDGVPTGYMTVDCFGGHDIESAAIAGSTADWDCMKAVLTDYAREQKATQILFICDPADTVVAKKLESLGLKASFSEYRMEFAAASFSPAAIQNISLKKALASDAAYIKMLDEEVYGKDILCLSAADLSNTLIILQDNQPVGKLRTSAADGIYGIHGVAVESGLRGQGIGAQALTLLLNHYMSLGIQSIYLEVDSENPAAFHLYKKLGFRVSSEFRYYPYAL